MYGSDHEVATLSGFVYSQPHAGFRPARHIRQVTDISSSVEGERLPTGLPGLQESFEINASGGMASLMGMNGKGIAKPFRTKTLAGLHARLNGCPCILVLRHYNRIQLIAGRN